MQLRPLLLAVFFTLAISVASADAEHVVWSGLVIAENVPQPAPIPPELTTLEQTLKDLFGYNQFEVIGQSNKTLKTGEEDWLANSKYFGLHVAPPGGIVYAESFTTLCRSRLFNALICLAIERLR